MLVTLLVWGYDFGMVGATVAFANTNNSGGSSKGKGKANDATDATIVELKAIARLLPYRGSDSVTWYDRIKQGGSDWALLALTVVTMGGPTLHNDAKAKALALGKSITGNKSLSISGTPRLDYTARNGKVGVASAFRTSYHPRLFAKRTKLGSDFALVDCVTGIRYDRSTCDNPKAVTYKGKVGGMLERVRLEKAAKSKGKAANKPTTEKPNNESANPNDARRAKIDAEKAAQAANA